MRLILLLLIISACTGLQQRDPPPEPPPEPKPIEQPEPKKPESKPITIITVNPPAKPQPICVPLAADDKKRILEVLDCLIESDKTKKTR